MDLSFSLFHSVSFQLDAAKNKKKAVEDISAMQIVKNIWPMRLYHTMQIEGASEPNYTIDTFSTHVMGGVDKLHTEGLSGDGIFVAIIDTGIDYMHPTLGAGFGPGFKVAYGTDLVGDAYNGSNTPFPDLDPYTECNEHGTHVAGSVGANPNPYNFTGVASNATLGMYRVS